MFDPAVAYAPNSNGPIEMVWEMDGRGERQPRAYFDFDAMLARVEVESISAGLGWGRTSGMRGCRGISSREKSALAGRLLGFIIYWLSAICASKICLRW